jgi:spore germination cell wall hydrolase CwlJ-like protein
MNLSAPTAVTKPFLPFIRAVCFIIGISVVVSALNFAVGYRINNQLVAPVTASAKEIQAQLTCMARNIYWEAASEPFEGKVAVAQVTMNRMRSGKFADTVCGVVHQRNTVYNKIVCQFSWLCETTHITKPVYRKLYEESEEVARMVMLEGFKLKALEQALYYHADYVNPKWNKEKIIQIGHHIFYKEKGNG